MRTTTFNTFVITFLLITTSATALAHTASIEVEGGNRYKAVRLTPPIYNAANSDLSDLRIKDGAGEAVPYFINSASTKSYSSRETYPMALINAYMKEESFYFDYKLATPLERDIIATSLEFATRNKSFAKEVDVYGSYDNIHWVYVQKDKLYSIDNKSKLAIKLVSPQKFTHYRLKLANNLEKISFDAVNLVYSTKTSGERYFIETLEPDFSIESDDKRTYIAIAGLKNLRLHDITIHTDSMFKRNLRTPQGKTHEIYNLSLNGTSYAHTTIPLNRAVSQAEIYTITIADDDDKPIKITGVTVRYYADEIVFDGSAAAPYTLEFGDARKTAPSYDIKRYKDDILMGAIDIATPGAINYTTIAPPRDYKLIFNTIIIIVTLLLGSIIILKLKNNAEH